MTHTRSNRSSTAVRGLIACLVLAGIAWYLLPRGAALSAQSNKEAQHRNLTSFGLVGDGVTDNTTAIQNAIDAGIGNLHFHKGTYRITRPLVIDLDNVGFTSMHSNGVATIVMDGPGPAIRIVGTHFKSAGPEGFEDRVWQKQRMPLIDGIGITATHDEADGIEAVGTMQLTISRVHIRHCRHGIRLVQNNRNVIISDCHIYENSGIGIYYDNVNLHQSNITGSHISYNGGGGIVSKAGNVRNIHITGCDIESNMSPDQPPTANVLIDCREGSHGTAEVAITGCTIQHNHTAPGSANVRIIGRSNPTARQSLVREGNVTISGNVFSDVFVNVHLQDCRGVVMTGNTFWMGFQHNLLIEDSSNIVIGENNLDRNPRYDYGDTTQANNSIIIRDSEDCTINGLHISNVYRDPAAVTIQRCRRMNINNCTILDCDNVGLLLEDLSDSRVAGCLIRDDRPNSQSVPVRIIGGRGNLIDESLMPR